MSDGLDASQERWPLRLLAILVMAGIQAARDTLDRRVAAAKAELTAKEARAILIYMDWEVKTHGP